MTHSGSIASRGNAGSESLKTFLSYLDTDPDKAWLRYDLMRRRLLTFFEGRHCSPAIDYADETIDRLASRPDVNEIRDIEEFAIGIARNLVHEGLRKNRRMEAIDDENPTGTKLAGSREGEDEIIEHIDQETKLQGLQQCLLAMPDGEGHLLLDYYSDDGVQHDEHRRTLAKQQGIEINALRVRMNRSRDKLRQALTKWLAERVERFHEGTREGQRAEGMVEPEKP